jgi:hypothetical protein
MPEDFVRELNNVLLRSYFSRESKKIDMVMFAAENRGLITLQVPSSSAVELALTDNQSFDNRTFPPLTHRISGYRRELRMSIHRCLNELSIDVTGLTGNIADVLDKGLGDRLFSWSEIELDEPLGRGLSSSLNWQLHNQL